MSVEQSQFTMGRDPKVLRKGSDYKNMASLLRVCNTKHRDERIGYFWSSKLLSRIMTKERVVEALASECGFRLKFFYSKKLVETIEQRHLKIFALLLLLSRGGNIRTFIEHNLCDEDLPLDIKSVLGEPELYRRGSERTPLECFTICGWHPNELESFYETQWRLIVPYFQSPRDDGTVHHYELHPQTILPWSPIGGRDGEEVGTGGFGTVERVRIDPSSHGFAKFLKEISLVDGPDFAVKSIRRRDDFEHEISMLSHLGRTPHPHLISLLATYSLNDSWNMLFPLADCDLYTFWETHDGPLMDGSKASSPVDDMFWITTQITGLVSALTVIHNVGSAYHPNRGFGRHGDIKADNILCLQSCTNPRGTLVLSDFGLSSSHKETTQLRKSKDTVTIAFTPAYRPPECDIDLPKPISRLSDIWNLGCLLLEMACWILGGKDELTRFHSIRTVVSAATGAASSVYFEVKQTEGKNFEFRIKREVTNYIATLHSHNRCTSYVHDLLDAVEQQMLVVDTAQRSTADGLLQRFKEYEERARASTEYMMESCPPLPLSKQAPDKPIIQGVLSPDIIRLDLDHERNKARMSAQFSRASRITRRSVRLPEVSIPDISSLSEHPPKPRKKVDDMGHSSIPLNHTHQSFEAPLQNLGQSTRDVLTEDSDDNELQDIQNIAQVVHSTVCRVYNEHAISGATEEVLISITWQLQQCIRDELEGNPDLGSVLTISGNASHSWAAPCLEYVKVTWGSLGVQILGGLEICLRNRLRATDNDGTLPETTETAMECDFPPVDDESTHPSLLRFKGTVEETSTLCQFLAWIAATFRMPKKGELSCSSVDFEAALAPDNGSRIRFRINLRDLWQLGDRERGTCWKALFPSTVMATGFPIPQTPGIFGLQIPFGAMLEMVDVLCDVNLEDANGNHTGVYFDSASFVLYATDYSAEQNTVQWHLKKKSKGKERNQALRPDHGSGPPWARHLNIETLSEASAVLGYCGEVEVQLGTASRIKQFEKYQYSLASTERPPPEISLSGLTASVGIKGVTVGAAAAIRYRSGYKVAREEAKTKEYLEVLDDAEAEVAILFETSPGQERAWMVPQLSLILELFNFWAVKRGLQDVHYATPGPNNGSGARLVLEDEEYINRPAVKKMIPSDTGLCIGDIIKRIHNRIDKRTVENSTGGDETGGIIKLGSCGLLGWDWLELAGAPSLSDRRSIPNFSEPCWMPFTQDLKVPVFMGQNLGQVITPVNQGELCGHWYPIPGGTENSYLVASVASIQKLAEVSGHKEPWYFRDNFMWDVRGELLFEPCADECIAEPSRCRKKPQILLKRKATLVKRNLPPEMVRAVPEIKENGAVVFAKELKDEKTLPEGKAKSSSFFRGNLFRRRTRMV